MANGLRKHEDDTGGRGGGTGRIGYGVQVDRLKSVGACGSRTGSDRCGPQVPDLVSSAQAPLSLLPPHAFVLPPPHAARPSNPSDSLLRHNSIVLILHLPPVRPTFLQIRPPPPQAPLYVQRAYLPRNACSRNTYVSYARNVRTNELHVSRVNTRHAR